MLDFTRFYMLIFVTTWTSCIAFRCTDDGDYADPDSGGCISYFHCSRGISVTVYCPDGQAFHIISKTCLPTTEVKCEQQKLFASLSGGIENERIRTDASISKINTVDILVPIERAQSRGDHGVGSLSHVTQKDPRLLIQEAEQHRIEQVLGPGRQFLGVQGTDNSLTPEFGAENSYTRSFEGSVRPGRFEPPTSGTTNQQVQGHGDAPRVPRQQARRINFIGRPLIKNRLINQRPIDDNPFLSRRPTSRDSSIENRLITRDRINRRHQLQRSLQSRGNRLAFPRQNIPNDPVLPTPNEAPNQHVFSSQEGFPIQPVIPRQNEIPNRPILSNQGGFPIQPVIPRQNEIPNQPVFSSQEGFPIQPVIPRQIEIPNQPVFSSQEGFPIQSISRQNVIPNQPSVSGQFPLFINPGGGVIPNVEDNNIERREDRNGINTEFFTTDNGDPGIRIGVNQDRQQVTVQRFNFRRNVDGDQWTGWRMTNKWDTDGNGVVRRNEINNTPANRWLNQRNNRWNFFDGNQWNLDNNLTNDGRDLVDPGRNTRTGYIPAVADGRETAVGGFPHFDRRNSVNDRPFDWSVDLARARANQIKPFNVRPRNLSSDNQNNEFINSNGGNNVNRREWNRKRVVEGRRHRLVQSDSNTPLDQNQGDSVFRNVNRGDNSWQTDINLTTDRNVWDRNFNLYRGRS